MFVDIEILLLRNPSSSRLSLLAWITTTLRLGPVLSINSAFFLTILSTRHECLGLKDCLKWLRKVSELTTDRSVIFLTHLEEKIKHWFKFSQVVVLFNCAWVSSKVCPCTCSNTRFLKFRNSWISLWVSRLLWRTSPKEADPRNDRSIGPTLGRLALIWSRASSSMSPYSKLRILPSLTELKRMLRISESVRCCCRRMIKAYGTLWLTNQGSCLRQKGTTVPREGAPGNTRCVTHLAMLSGRPLLRGVHWRSYTQVSTLAVQAYSPSCTLDEWTWVV